MEEKDVTESKHTQKAKNKTELMKDIPTSTRSRDIEEHTTDKTNI
jgi:hypothetical protein